LRILLDTQAWLWMQASPQRFAPDALELVADARSALHLSAASSWEIAIKYALGRLPLPVPPWEYVPDRMATSAVVPLPIEHSHALEVSRLPAHHRDPFDRLLIAQARIEGLAILTSDPAFTPYGVEVMAAG
jgi:PIN domain nuclease of toxin-antitoxin system